MKGRIVLILFVLGAGGSACRPFVHYDPDRTRTVADNSSQVHVVRQGDTLYSIAFQNGHDYRTVARWNGIQAPYTIYPGQEIRITPADTTAPVSATSTTSTTSTETPSTVPAATRRSPAAAMRMPEASASTITWRWPSEGEVIGHFSANDPGKKGLDIAGRLGQSVHAAADGRVVYSGNGLRGYGNLIIIKHDDTFFSAYAHNDKVHVQENDTVKSGQHIADMGNSGTEQVRLRFEIRRNGVPTNPLTYLPKKGS